MEKSTTNFQLLDNYVSEFNMEVMDKIKYTDSLDINSSVSFSIVNIDEINLIGQVELTYDIEVNIKEKEAFNIALVMNALFHTDNKISTKSFEELLKFQGAPIVSNLCLAYINSVTALSGMPPLNMPIIDFNDFFKNSGSKK